MAEMTITLPEEHLQKIQQAAGELGVAVEEIIRLSVAEFIDRRLRFEENVDYLLRKNAELYRRLAQ